METTVVLLLLVLLVFVLALGAVSILFWDTLKKNKKECDEDRKRLIKLENAYIELIRQFEKLWSKYNCNHGDSCQFRVSTAYENAPDIDVVLAELESKAKEIPGS